MRHCITILLILILSSCSSAKRTSNLIVDKPINFDKERRDLSVLYMQERYGLIREEPVIEPKMIVLHWTAIPDFKGSFKAFENNHLPGTRSDLKEEGSLNVSTHFLVDRDGKIYRLMPENLMGRHVIGLNHVAIGIENVGGTAETPLTKKQLKANIRLVKYLKSKYNIDYLIGHHEYRNFEGHELWLEKDADYRTKKSDPGNEFMRKVRKATVHLRFKSIPKTSNNEIQ